MLPIPELSNPSTNLRPVEAKNSISGLSWITYYPEPVTLHSGYHSHWLVDATLIYADPQLRKIVLDCWEPIAASWRHPYILGIPRGGVPWAQALAERIDAPWGTHLSAYQRGSLLVVDDVLTTGTSLRAISAKSYFVVVNRNGDPEIDLPVTAWATMYLPLIEDDLQ